MPRHIDAFMDTVPLSSLGPIYIQQVHEDAPSMEIAEASIPGRYGARLITRKRQSLRVTIEAAVGELFNLKRRAGIMEQIAGWAQGRILELSSRPYRRLRVVCTGEPTLGEVRDYTAACRIELTAYDVPYWEDKGVTAMALTNQAGASAAANVYIPGTVASPVDLLIRPSAATLHSCTVTVGENVITLTGLSIPATEALTFRRSEHDILIIEHDGEMLLSTRTAASSDDLMTPPGYSPFSFSADVACQVTVNTRGRWA